MNISNLISALLLSLSFFVGASEALAQQRDPDAEKTHALMTPQEQELYQKAKKRLYPGGKDEESLRVQSQLPTVTRKMAPAQEAPTEEPEEHQESSTD